MNRHLTLPIVLLTAGILLIYAALESTNVGAYVGYALCGFACMIYAVACIMEGDDV